MIANMKRLIFLILAMLTSALCARAPVAVRAEERTPLYAVAEDDNVYFYSQADDKSGLFILPRTYYVRVLAVGEPFCRVEYQEDVLPYKKLTGYCRKGELTFVDFVPARPFLNKEISVTYTLPESGSPVGETFGSIEVSYLYYGSYRAGTSLFYYVCSDGKFGYVPAAEELTYDLNTDYLSAVSGTEEPPAESGKTSSLSPAQIVAVCVICLSAAAVAVFVVRGKRKPAPRDESADF